MQDQNHRLLLYIRFCASATPDTSKKHSATPSRRSAVVAPSFDSCRPVAVFLAFSLTDNVDTEMAGSVVAQDGGFLLCNAFIVGFGDAGDGFGAATLDGRGTGCPHARVIGNDFRGARVVEW